jgi:hypothetical protein
MPPTRRVGRVLSLAALPRANVGASGPRRSARDGDPGRMRATAIHMPSEARSSPSGRSKRRSSGQRLPDPRHSWQSFDSRACRQVEGLP